MYSDLLAGPTVTTPLPVRRRRRLWLAVLLVLVAGLVAGLLRYAGDGEARTDVGGLPWPSTGEAALRIGGTTIDGPGSQTAVPIASVAKVMTAYVVLRDHLLGEGQDGPTITVTQAEADAYPGQLAAGESLVPVQAGERLTERQALEALLLPSADNVAWILARWDAGDQHRFVARMNATARRLGMRHTVYTDASGLDPSTVSSARDQLTLAAVAMKVQTLAAIAAEQTATLPVAGRVHNYNTLLGSDGIVGLKTGSTSAAGGCLVFAARTRVDGRDVTVLGVVLGQPGKGRKMLTAALRAGHRLELAGVSAAQAG